MRNNSTIVNRKNDKDFEKFKKSLENLKRVKAVTLMFSLRYFEKTCVNNANDNKTYCNYLFETSGHKIVIDLINNFNKKEQALTVLLSIINSCLISLPEDITAFKLVDGKLCEYLFDILNNSQFLDCKNQAFNILNKLVIYDSAHEIMVQQGTLEFINKNLEYFIRKDVNVLKSQEMIRIAQIIDIVKYFGYNNDMAEELGKSGLIENMIKIYTQNEDISFLRDLVVKSLVIITENDDILEVIKNSNLDLKKLVNNCLKSRNVKLISNVEIIINNLMEQNELEKYIEEAKKPDCDESTIIFISFLSSNEISNELFSDRELLDNLINKLKQPNQSEELRLSIIKIMTEITETNEENVSYLNEKGVFTIILNTIEDTSDDSYMYIIEILNLFSKSLNTKGKYFSDILKEKDILIKFIEYFLKLSKQYNLFRSKNMSIPKAIKSIEYHKSETSRALLEATSNINLNDIASMELALSYITCEDLSIGLMIFFCKMIEVDSNPSNKFQDEFFENCWLLMKVFKKSKEIHEHIFKTLDKIEYDFDQGKSIIRLNYPRFLCNVIWNKPNWRFFSLNVLRFIDQLIKNNKIIDLLKGGISTIKLVASIKNFLNEDDYKSFEENDEEDEEEEVEIKKITKDILTYGEEREIHKKATHILNKLLDTATVLSFKKTITKTLQNFKPMKQTILILRAEYAVLTVANGINHYGCEGLKANLQDWLKGNLEIIEKASKYRDFQDKEKLLADCIKCIANYVCITWNENGKNLYENKEVSKIVFGQFEKYLKKSNKPLKSYVMLQAFKNWLIERIEIIENSNNLMRPRIYDPISFMMVDESIRNQLITDVMDSLYGTHQKFSENEKVVSLNMEVIILLGYIYPEWKTRAGKNFIPQIIEVIENENLSKDCNVKAIELLKHIIGCDGKSDEPNQENLNAAAQKGAIEAITKSISDNNYDDKYIENCKPLLEELGQKEEILEDSYNLIDKLIKIIKDFNAKEDKRKLRGIDKLDEEENQKRLDEIDDVIKANDQLNALCIVDPLRIYAFDKDHTGTVNDFWFHLEDDRSNDNNNLGKKNVLDKAEKGCVISISQHLKSLKDNNDLERVFGNKTDDATKKGLLKNCLNCLKRNKKDEQMVNLNSKIINKLFPSDYANPTRGLAKNLNFQPDLEQLLKNHGKSKNPNLANEVSNLYMNLSAEQDDNMIERIIKKNLRKLNQDLNDSDVNGCLASINSLLPFANHSIFNEIFDESDFLDYILKMLRLLHKNLKEKTENTSKDLVEQALGSSSTPDIGNNNRKILIDDIKLAKKLTNFILSLPENLKIKVRDHKEIIKLSDIAGVLNGSTQTFELFQDYLKNPENVPILQNEKIVECSVFLLMKNNKDSFKKEDLAENIDLHVSTLSFIKKTNLNDMKASRISLLKVEEDKDMIISENVKEFGKMVNNLLSEDQFENLIEKYIRNMNSYLANDENCLTHLLSISRIISAIVSSQDENSNKLNFEPYADKLNKAFNKFLDVLKHEKVPNKKLLSFFENNFNHIAKKLDGTSKSLRGEKLWNKLLERYFILSPELIKNNPVTIFENLNLTRPLNLCEVKAEDKFIESEAGIEIKPEISENGCLTEKNAQNSDKLILNFYRAVSSNVIPDDFVLNNLEILSKSSVFNRSFVKSDSFGHFVNKLNDSKHLINPKFFIKNSEILSNVGITLTEEKKKGNNDLLNEFYKISTPNILVSYVNNIEDNEEKYMDISLKVLNNLDDVIKNKSGYFEINLPKLLKNHLGDNWEGKENAVTLLCKILNDSSLAEKCQELNLFEEVQKNLEKNLFTKKTIIKNPDFSNFTEISDLSDEKKQRNIELNAYLLGELSRNKDNALKLTKKEKKVEIFQLYEEFEKNGHIPIIATKLIQATRNGVYQLTEEQMEEYQEKIDDLILRIPPQIKKYKNFKKTPEWLQDILDFFTNFKKHQIPKSALARILKQLSENNNKLPKDRLKDLNELSTIYKELSDKLKQEKLSNDEAKVLELLNEEVLNLIKQPNSQAPYTLMNLEVPLHLRLIANSENSSMIEKSEALELLNEFVKNDDIREKMLSDKFFTEKSSELINYLSKKGVDDLEDKVLDVLNKDLVFMKKLTDEAEGVEYALESISEDNKLIDNLLNVLLSELDNEKLKIDALQVLKNLIKFGNHPELEERLINNIKPLLEQNKNLTNLFTELVDLTNELVKKSTENRDKLLEKNILQPIKNGLQRYRYPDGKELSSKVASLVYNLSNENPDCHDYIFDSEILPLLSTAFLNKDSLKELHQDVAKSLLQLSFGNQEKKLKLVNLDFIKGLVALLIHYSSKENYDEEMISLVLKCMANFSVILEGVKTLLFDGVIPAFRNFFEEYKEKLPNQNKLMLCTISNLSYDPKEEFIDKIIKDKGIELILDTLDFYIKKKDEETAEAAIDALTHVSSSKNTLKYLEKTNTNAIDILVDILRQQLNDNLVYKGLRCLTRFCQFKPLSDKFMEKRGHGVTIDLFKPYQKELKIIFQSLKLLTGLVNKYSDKLEDFAFAGIPEKIIESFDMEWPVEIIKQIIDLFAKMTKIEMVKEILAEQFLEDLIKIMNKYFSKKSIIRNGTKLLSICSDNITSVDIIKHKEGNKLAHEILKKYISSESIINQNLILMENMIRMHKGSKSEYLSLKTDDKVENIVETTDPEMQKELNSQAITVLNLLRDKKFEEMKISEIQDEPIDEETSQNEENNLNSVPPQEDKDLEKLLPPDVQKFLKQGRILRVYGEDGVCRSMHFFLSKDMTDLKCKHPRENFVKQKWIIPIHQVKEVKYGYDKKRSPIAKSASFFRRAPKAEKCFAVFGPTLIDGPRNFHLLCDNSFDARKWFDYLMLVLTEYNKCIVNNLRGH